MRLTSRFAGLLGIAASCVMAHSASAAIMGLALGPTAPPAQWSDVSYTPFLSDAPETRRPVKQVDSPLGGTVVFYTINAKEQNKREKREITQVGSEWQGWGHGYTGNVYHDENLKPASTLILTLPEQTNGFYLFVMGGVPNPRPFSVTAENGPTLVDSNVDPENGASGFLFWATDGDLIQSIMIESDMDFAIGEFGISRSVNVPEPSCLVLLGVTGMLLGRRARSSCPAQA